MKKLTQVFLGCWKSIDTFKKLMNLSVHPCSSLYYSCSETEELEQIVSDNLHMLPGSLGTHKIKQDFSLSEMPDCRMKEEITTCLEFLKKRHSSLLEFFSTGKD